MRPVRLSGWVGHLSYNASATQRRCNNSFQIPGDADAAGLGQAGARRITVVAVFFGARPDEAAASRGRAKEALVPDRVVEEVDL